MLGYVTIGTNEIDRAIEFYDRLFEVIGVSRLWKHDRMAAWGRSRDECALCVASPFDGNKASVGNGCMVAIKVQDRKQVDALHKAALELGGRDEGAPGARGEHGFYGGYFRDLDGNKLNAYVPGS